jgi:SAM-dependent methyltransferase
MWPAESAYSRRHFDRLIATAGLGPGSRILEVGSGMGRFTRMFHEAGFDVVASDISPGQIASLRQRFPQIEAFVADAGGLQVPARPYDAVVGFFTLHHMPDLRATFAQIADAVAPGSPIAFCEPNAYYVPFYAQVLLTPRMSWSVEKGIRNMRRPILEPAMRAAGFEEVAFHHYGFFPPVLYNPRIGRLVDEGLDSLPVPGVVKAFQIATARRARD